MSPAAPSQALFAPPGVAVLLALTLAACAPNSTGLGDSSASSGEASVGEASEDPSADTSDGAAPGPAGPRKRKIELDPALAAGVGGTTILVALTPDRIEYDDVQPGGADLRFFDPDEAIAFPIQIERWEPGGTSYVWVRIPLPTLPDHLWMYYAEDEPFVAIDPAQVWDETFVAVWHMGLGEGSMVTDSTIHGHHLEPVGFTGDFDVDGFIGTAALLVPPAMPVDAGPLELPDPAMLALADGFTLEAWVWSAVGTTEATSHVIRKRGAYELHALAPMLTRPRLELRTADGSGPHAVEAGASLGMHAWTYLAVTYRAADGTLTLYRDGVLEDTRVIEGDAAGLAVAATEAVVQVGRGFNGVLDEVRVSAIARSPEWIRLQHAAMTDGLLEFDLSMPQ